MPLKKPIAASCQVSFLSVYMLWGTAVCGILLGIFDSRALLIGGVFSGLGLIFFWNKVIARRRQVTLDASSGRVSVSTASIFFQPKQRSYPLEMFGSVQSYILPGRYPRNRVELVTTTGGEALLVASFEPSNIARSFWALPTDGESKSAEILRQEIAGQLGLLDRGFLGNRLFGAPLA